MKDLQKNNSTTIIRIFILSAILFVGNYTGVNTSSSANTSTDFIGCQYYANKRNRAIKQLRKMHLNLSEIIRKLFIIIIIILAGSYVGANAATPVDTFTDLLLASPSGPKTCKNVLDSYTSDCLKNQAKKIKKLF